MLDPPAQTACLYCLQMKYASLLAQKLEQHGTQVWLVNTGELEGGVRGQVACNWWGGWTQDAGCCLVSKTIQSLLTPEGAHHPLLPALAGWTGGPYGVGCRMNLRHTFAIVDAMHSGELRGAEYETLPTFNLQVRWAGFLTAFPLAVSRCCAVRCLLGWDGLRCVALHAARPFPLNLDALAGAQVLHRGALPAAAAQQHLGRQGSLLPAPAPAGTDVCGQLHKVRGGPREEGNEFCSCWKTCACVSHA